MKLAGTSRHPNVATSGQRKQKSTSGKHRDVSSANSVSRSLKAKRGTRNRGIEERTNKGIKIRAAVT